MAETKTALAISFVATEDKVTKNGVRRFNDDDGHNIYLKPDELARIGNPSKVEIKIIPME